MCLGIWSSVWKQYGYAGGDGIQQPGAQCSTVEEVQQRH